MRRVYIERENNLIKVAIKEDEVIKECYVEEEDLKPKVGEIYKGVVKNIVPAMHSVFIDIGYEKNAYMSLQGSKKENGIKKGQEVLVEIIKEEVGKKGPKVSTSLSLPGAYAVITQDHEEIQLSKKILNQDFAAAIIEDLDKPKEVGITLRTKSAEADPKAVKREIERLLKLYKEIKNKFTFSTKLGMLYSDRGILSKVLRNYSEAEMHIEVDDEKDYEFYKNYIKENELKNISVKLYEGALSIFDSYGIEREILALRHNKINLPSGGNIVLEKTEAMHVVDVNTAQNTKGTSKEGAIFETNLEAAVEVVRQIKLRNLGGIILIDFIDMASQECKNKIISRLNEEFKDDKQKPRVYPFTELSLVQITRRKYGNSIMDYLLTSCEKCHGEGETLSLQYLISIISGKIRRIKEEQNVKNIHIQISSTYEKEIKEDINSFALKIGALDCNLYMEFIDHLENFKVEPLLFHSQIENLKDIRVFSAK